MKINLFDTGISGKGGHHFDYDRRLMHHLHRAGHEVHFYGYTGMGEAVIAELAAYGAVTNSLRPYQHAPLDPTEPYAAKLDDFLRKSEMIAEDLREAEKADLWIWPSMQAFELRGVTLSGTRARVAGCIHWDPGIEANTVSAMMWRAALLDAARNEIDFVPGSSEPELRYRFAPIVPSGVFKVLPHPYDGPPIAQPKSTLKRIGFFGHQRIERGVELIAALAKVLVGEGYEIVVQDSSHEQLCADLPGVEAFAFVEDMAALIAGCDLVVLPYGVTQYRSKGSGILAQCMALGIPVIGPLGTIPGRTIEQHGIGPVFPLLTGQAIYDTIKYARRHYRTYAETAFKTAQRFAKHNGGAQFAAAFVALAR